MKSFFLKNQPGFWPISGFIFLFSFSSVFAADETHAPKEPATPVAAPATAVVSAPVPVAAPAAQVPPPSTESQVPAASSPAAADGSTEEEDEYKIDYEDDSDEEEAPAPKAVKRGKGPKGKKSLDKDSTMQGSRASYKFITPAKSETKSVYKKNGVSLDVDSD